MKTGKVTFICSNCFKTVDSPVEELQDSEFIHYYAVCPLCKSKVEIATLRKKFKKPENK